MSENAQRPAPTAPLPVTPLTPFEKKVRWGTRALYLERLWPRLWLIVGVVGLFVLASLAGFWIEAGQLAHKLALAAFAVALVGAFVYAARVQWPSREDAIRRIEQRSGFPHRPATSYEDTLTLNHDDPSTQAIWQAHKTRLADLVGRLRVGRPAPRTDRLDPFAVRGLMLLGMMMLLGIVGDSARDRVMAAFRFGPPLTAADARLDAWVTPPAYTSKPPILLADGQRGGLLMAGADGKPLEVPENSVIIARTSGIGAARLEIEMKPDNNGPVVRQAAVPPDPIPGAAPKTAAATAGSAGTSADVSEVRFTLKQSGSVRVLGGGSELARWAFAVTPDQPPRITMTKTPEISRRGSMKSFYRVEDDYGIATAEARFERIKPDAGNRKTAWAREGSVIKGPRLPYERPPTLNLRLPRASAKEPEAQSFHELASHPWAGMRARLTLVAKDHAGNVGRSQTIEMTVPERRFVKPLARAVVEQRRLLAADSRNTRRVLLGLDALTYEPAAFIQDRNVYLGLRSAYHRLRRDKTRAGIASVREQLWHIALRIEDGRSLSEKEQRLRDLQDQLSKAVQDGASDEEMQRLMQELRQALNEYLQELAQQGQNAPEDMQQGQNETMSQQDLERMLSQLENMMRQGSKDSAQEMLAQLRDLLDRLQRGQQGQGQAQRGQGQEMMQMLDQMGDIIGRQQQLMDDTFGAQRGQQPGQGQQGEQGQGQQPGQQGQGRGQQPGQQGQGRGQGQQPGQGQQGQNQQPGQGQGRGNSPGELGDRQGQLRDQLGRMREGLRKFGQQAPPQFDGAGEAMENSKRALERGDLETATREEGRALEQLRQGAQQLAEQMMRQMSPRFGQGPSGEVPRDPLGRPQRSEGPDLGTTVKVPDEIDIQRAREILEELRRRLGDQTRPTIELDYIERLLRRF